MTTDQPHKVIRDDIAYILPMGIFLVFTQVGVSWPAHYVFSYIAKTLIVPVALVMCWRYYTKIQWTHLGLGVVVGVVGLVQWVGMDKLLAIFFQWAHVHGGGWLDWVPVYGSIGVSGVPTDSFNPFKELPNPYYCWIFIVLRWGCASLVVPVMEELFWRDFLWRNIIAPADFKLAQIGERDRNAILFVALLFATVHIQWITAIGWGLLIAWLLIRTKSLGACIVAHGVTNFLLGAYVLYTHDWYFW
ncbi:MAG TPA: CAAX prenyl protease-related protein [Tepidisphaeraceae bacterium]|nr:CAAX prenyl protease-related protein [Tepidisphaeraceae bacterium]